MDTATEQRLRGLLAQLGAHASMADGAGHGQRRGDLSDLIDLLTISAMKVGL